MRTPFPEPVPHYDRDTTGIESLRPTPPGSARIPGLTVADYGLRRKTEFSTSAGPSRGRVCLWVSELELDFTYSALDVYVSKDYPEGTCERLYIARHEEEHVEVHRRLHQRYAGLLAEALAGAPGLPTLGNPAAFEDAEAGKKIVEGVIDRIADPIYKAFEEELGVEQGRLDTPESYRALQGLCPNWRQ